MQPDAENPAITRQIIETITVAHEYCLFYEQLEKTSRQEILAFFQKIGPLLYLKGSMLPQLTDVDEAFAERFVTEEQWEEIFKTLREKLGETDLYYALDENADSQQYSLADNMADIYQDMKDFVMLYQKAPNQSKEAAVYELQKLFENHWGKILLRALQAIHAVLYKDQAAGEFLDGWE